jgi:hypothetical protein
MPEALSHTVKSSSPKAFLLAKAQAGLRRGAHENETRGNGAVYFLKSRTFRESRKPRMEGWGS